MTVSLERQDLVSELTQQFTDEELLLELRRRGRLKTLMGEFVQEGCREEHCPPEEYILRRLCRDIGDQIGIEVAAKKFQLIGQKREEGHFIPGPYTSRHLGVRYTVPFNFVVDK